MGGHGHAGDVEVVDLHGLPLLLVVDLVGVAICIRLVLHCRLGVEKLSHSHPYLREQPGDLVPDVRLKGVRLSIIILGNCHLG